MTLLDQCVKSTSDEVERLAAEKARMTSPEEREQMQRELNALRQRLATVTSKYESDMRKIAESNATLLQIRQKLAQRLPPRRVKPIEGLGPEFLEHFTNQPRKHDA